MAWRLRSSVVRGEIDNRVKGKITGKIWLAGRDGPVELKLEGNGYRDVAGCLFTFENPVPQLVEDEHTDLFAEQVGAIGDYTASRKVRAFDIPVDEALAMIRRGEKPPEHMANCLYLEWFSERNGRVVIESYDYEMKISDTAWSLDEQGESEQLERNTESMVGFMQRLGEAIEQADEPPYDPEDDKPMDEFEWERLMKKADRLSDKFGELREKYKDHPDRDQIVARKMGWPHIPDRLENFPDIEPPGVDGSVPNPSTEGVDWVWDKHGNPAHPLQLKATAAAEKLIRECEEAGLLEGGIGDKELNDLLFYGLDVGVQLAGALNGLAYDQTVDRAFVVANLKRALPVFDKMMLTLGNVRKKELMAADRFQHFSDDMFSIRAEILQLIEQFRNGFG